MSSADITAQDRIFSKLKTSLEGQKSQAAFCCGGSSKINDALSKPDIQFKEAPPVILHWASGDGNPVQKLAFSQDTLSTDGFNTSIQRLNDSCQPASFGKGGKDVLDGKGPFDILTRFSFQVPAVRPTDWALKSHTARLQS